MHFFFFYIFKSIVVIIYGMVDHGSLNACYAHSRSLQFVVPIVPLADVLIGTTLDMGGCKRTGIATGESVVVTDLSFSIIRLPGDPIIIGTLKVIMTDLRQSC